MSGLLRRMLAIGLCCALPGALQPGGSPALAAPKKGSSVDVARLDVDQAKHVEIVAEEISKDGSDFSLTLRPKNELFTVDFELLGRDFKHVKITILGAKKSEIVRYFTDLKRRTIYIELARHPGVDIYQTRPGPKGEQDTVIDFVTPKAAKLLPPGGRLLFKQTAVPGADVVAASKSSSTSSGKSAKAKDDKAAAAKADDNAKADDAKADADQP